MSSDDVSVRLVQSYQWRCPDCSLLNHTPVLPLELTPTEREVEFRAYAGLDEWEAVDDDELASFQLFTCPAVITCTRCGASFASEGDGGYDCSDDL